LKVLVTIYFWLAFVLTAPVVVAIGFLVFAATAPFDPDRHVVHRYICAATFSYLRLNPGWRVSIQGREHLPQGACVLVANHQSMADVVAVMGLRFNFKYVSKASLFSLPLVGWMMKLARYVHLERGRVKSTRKMMDACRRWLRRGVPVLIFPEGTYAEGPQRLPFKRGAFQLAIEEKVPVVPVVVQGTTGLVEGDGPWLSPRCRIRVAVQAPIPPEALGEDAAGAGAEVRARFERWLAAG